MTWIVAAFSLGLLGSFHCIGMCGPIAIALPVHHFSGIKKQTAILLYNLGRAFTYSFLGLLFGLLGQSFYLGGFQQSLSVVLGVFLLIGVVLPSFSKYKIPSLGFMYSFVNSIKQYLKLLFKQKSLDTLFLIGVLNGLLPCGLVYVGITGAIASGDYLSGALFMFFFGMGTLPVMMAVSVFGQFISIRYRNAARKAVPIVISAMAVFLILRGLNLGIPYVSPKLSETDITNSQCESHSVLIECTKPKSESSATTNDPEKVAIENQNQNNH